MEQARVPYILGIDLGTSSLGWALVRLESPSEGGAPRPAGLLDLGVRVFEAGLDEMETGGRGTPRGAARRQARSRRRLLERRRRRMSRLFALLQGAGLLPAHGDPKNGKPFRSSERHAVLQGLARELVCRWSAPSGRTLPQSIPAERVPHLLPYLLRAVGRHAPLEPHELGLALYHLGHRRGFLSNRKAKGKDAEEEGLVRQSITALEAEMGDLTLGEFLVGVEVPRERVRSRYTARGMYEREFELIWRRQAEFQPSLLTEALKRKIQRVIFHQRPLKAASGLVGVCELEWQSKRRRAPWGILAAQRFRMLQKVNDLLVALPGQPEVPLTAEQRSIVLDVLEREGDLTFPQARKALKLPRMAKFNLERGDEKKIPGNRTLAKLAKVFGDAWSRLSIQEQAAVVDDLMTIQNERARERRARRRWGLSPEAALRFAQLELEPGYCSLSRQAIARLLPDMEQGVPYATARRAHYPERFAAGSPLDSLPPVSEAVPALRNPLVSRSLTELRHVVNAIVERYGRPERVRVELARDLKRSAEQRAEAVRRNRKNESRRDEAKRKLAENGIGNPSRADVEKLLLAEECGWICPYTGLSIGWNALFGDAPRFDVEHIVPFSRSLDDSFLNKTLCELSENRKNKRNRTPWETYAADSARWGEMEERIRHWPDKDAAELKLRRFQWTPEDIEKVYQSDFTSRHLNDTRYASVLAQDYLGMLFGGTVDADGTRRVQASAGMVTAYLRSTWDLNRILGDGPLKSRDDHRHHAVDALCIALTAPATLRALSTLASQGDHVRRRFGAMEPPWEGFLDEARSRVRSALVAHRPERKRKPGALHEETHYSPEKRRALPGGTFEASHHVRKRLDALTPNEVDAIVDPVVRQKVKAALSGEPAKKVFSDEKNLPVLQSAAGRLVPIRKARIRVSREPTTIGAGSTERNVISGSNHHMEVVEFQKPGQKVRWQGVLVTALEAARRKVGGEPVVQRDHGAGRLVFSLAPGDTIEVSSAEGPCRMVVRSVSEGKVEFVQDRDARLKKDIQKAGGWTVRSPDRLREMGARLVRIDPLGLEIERHG